LVVAGPSFAAPVKIEAVVTPKEQIRLDFADGTMSPGRGHRIMR